jgi:hypothetical protein
MPWALRTDRTHGTYTTNRSPSAQSYKSHKSYRSHLFAEPTASWVYDMSHAEPQPPSHYRRRCATRLTTYANARIIRVRIPKFFLGDLLKPTGRIKYPSTKRIATIVSATIMSPGRSALNI